MQAQKVCLYLIVKYSMVINDIIVGEYMPSTVHKSSSCRPMNMKTLVAGLSELSQVSYHCVCDSGCSAGVSRSFLGYLLSQVSIAVRQ